MSRTGRYKIVSVIAAVSTVIGGVLLATRTVTTSTTVTAVFMVSWVSGRA